MSSFGHLSALHPDFVVRDIGVTLSGAGEALPLDTQYRWAQERYSKRRRALDIWTSLAVLRTRLWLLDQK